MGLFSSIMKGVQTVIEDLNTPESFKKGQKFEDFTRKEIFTEDRYKLLKKTHDYKQNHADFVEDTLEPDYKFECLETKKQFYVEAKYRSWFYHDKLEIFSKAQFERLKEINKTETVFVIIGIAGEADDPEFVCLVPMNDIKSPSLNDEFLDDYDIAHNVSLSPKKLWNLIKTNDTQTSKDIKTNSVSKKKTNDSGFCIRCKDNLKIDITHPFCKPCYQEWNKYKKTDYAEKFCHICGQSSNKISFDKPVCYSCYKSNNL